jgi:hypothetical protein
MFVNEQSSQVAERILARCKEPFEIQRIAIGMR